MNKYNVSNTGEYKIAFSENGVKRKILYPYSMSIRITEEMKDSLDTLAAYEKMKPGTLCRQEILTMIRRYERNPQYKRWLKLLEKVPHQ